MPTRMSRLKEIVKDKYLAMGHKWTNFKHYQNSDGVRTPQSARLICKSCDCVVNLTIVKDGSVETSNLFTPCIIANFVIESKRNKGYWNGKEWTGFHQGVKRYRLNEIMLPNADDSRYVAYLYAVTHRADKNAN